MHTHPAAGDSVSGDSASGAVPRSICLILVFCVAFALIYLLMIRIRLGQQIDSDAFRALYLLNNRFMWPAHAFRLLATVALALTVLVLGVRALANRRYSGAFRAAVLVVGSVGLTELLKYVVLQRPQFGGYGQENTFPSGHVAFAVSGVLAIAAMLPPSRWRREALLVAGLFAVGVSWASVVAYAHRPSDVIGGSLIVGVVASAVFWRRRSTIGAYPVWIVALLSVAVAAGALVMIGRSLPAQEEAWGAVISLVGWFFVCIVPAIIVIGLSPPSTSRHVEDSSPV